MCGTFEPDSPQARALDVHRFLFEELKLKHEDLKAIELEPGVKKFYFKLADSEKFRRILAQGQGTFVHVGDVTSQVALTDAGSPGWRVLRVFRLPVELPSQALADALAAYGTVRDVAYEKWTNYEGKGILNGIRNVKIELKKNVPSYMRIQGVEALILYDGQPKTCRKCGQEGHLYFEKEKCPGRPAAGGRRWEDAAKKREEQKRKEEELKREEEQKKEKEMEEREQKRREEEERKAQAEQQKKDKEEQQRKKAAKKKEKEEAERKAAAASEKTDGLHGSGAAQPSGEAGAGSPGGSTPAGDASRKRPAPPTPPPEEKSTKELRADDEPADDELALSGQQSLERDMILMELEGLHGQLTDDQYRAVTRAVVEGMTALEFRRRTDEGLEEGDPILEFAEWMT